MIIMDCGDNSCKFAPRPIKGMRTNGGCRCFNDLDSKRRLFVYQIWQAVVDRDSKIAALEAERDILRKKLQEVSWRLHNPYDAFLRDSMGKDNCGNCVNAQPPTISHNSDRISCKFADGWPHWTYKCKHWEVKK